MPSGPARTRPSWIRPSARSNHPKSVELAASTRGFHGYMPPVRRFLAGEEIPGVAGGLAQLGHRLLLDLADPLAGQLEVAGQILQGARLAAVETEPQPDDLPLALVQGLEQLLDLAAEHAGRHRVERRGPVGVGHQIAELALAVVTD